MSQMFRMSVSARRAVLVAHVVSSVGWLGLTIGNLTLAITGLTTADPGTQRAVFVAMDVVGGTLLIPVSLTAFGTGLALSLGTRWGLLRHRWVLAKFVLTLVAVVLTPLSLLPGVRAAAEAVSAAPAGTLVDLGGTGSDLLAAGCVSSSMYLACVVLSITKPWGRTRWGRRALADRPRPVTAGRGTRRAAG
ncbi:hypothetical protein B0I33_103384 [Prauserella shujinwangii]|uniref:DUF2269 domain-containing protein n=1 Tax=Prauserella shujinwangii TaxID=1453103 RepID=A0A2T0LZ21_9PSEU|nr:hypothetical protein [Prauserella shujinwangii]PRX49349.1 hypothetical protein B0I33_103384 [Prauserella shujinwangii]